MEYDTDHCWNAETDRMDKRKLKIKCPSCQRVYAALCSPKTKPVDSGLQWVGCDYQESYTVFKTVCRCGHEYKFTTVCS